MAATIQFLAGTPDRVQLSNLGLGFYGPGNFSTPIKPGQWADNTYVSDATGSQQGPKASNTKFFDDYSATLGTGDTHVLTDIPNDLAPLQIRLTTDEPCLARNATFIFYDRNDDNPGPPVGVTAKVAEIVHPITTMAPNAPTGTGATRWSTPGGAGGSINGRVYDPPVPFTDSPGVNSVAAGSPVPVESTVHEWFAAIAVSPDTIGSKTQFALMFVVEYV